MEQTVLNPDVLLVIGSVESQYDAGQFDKTDLVCKEDGREVLDMESLKEHLKEGHKVFYLFIIEKIFQLPGLGQHFVGSVFNSDYTLVQATTVFYAALLVLINLGTDILQAWLNPRVRLT